MTTRECHKVQVTRDGLVYPCQGLHYKNGQHWCDFPQLSPPRRPHKGDIDFKTEQPVEVPAP